MPATLHGGILGAVVLATTPGSTRACGGSSSLHLGRRRRCPPHAQQLAALHLATGPR
jgi:hypothetical protein